MKQHLRFRGRYCPKRIQPICLLFTFFLIGVGGKGAFGQERPPVPRDTADASRDTIAIEEVEINAGYYTTTRKTSTGNIARVTAEDIANTPAFNPLASLAARVPGLVVSQSNGVPGSSYQVQLRGRNSITQGSEPLYIINGVPFAVGGEFLNSMANATGSLSGGFNSPASGLSPFNMINAEDIMSIEVLKDADALAIYGSRGANGVILITTKSGQAGETRIDAGFQQGYGRANHRFRMSNTREYVAMRKEAFANDGLVPSADPRNPGYAPDLMLWDTTRYTDLQELLTGGTAGFTNAQLGISGGTGQTRFRIGGAYKKESGVTPGGQSNNLASLNAQVSHASVDGRLQLALTSGISKSMNQSTATDLSAYITLPPNLPTLHDGEGNLIWEESGYAFDNPLSYLEQQYNGISDNSSVNLTASYRVFKGFTAKLNTGYLKSNMDEIATTPQTAYDPTKNLNSSLRLAEGGASSWIVEPQITYRVVLNRLTLDAMFGGTWQHSRRGNRSMQGDGFADDLLIGAIEAATAITVTNNFGEYNYQAAFGRLAFSYEDRYVLNFTGRRDGSSRFGPGRQYANFGAVGAAWVISEEPFMEGNGLISFAKLRGSYGITGNDQINDYQYLDAWETTFFTSLDGPGIRPIRSFNPEYAWEVNRKLEFGAEISLFRNRLFLTAAFFSNVSDNQLIDYRLPSQAGFNSMLRNFGATVQNRGWEFSIDLRHMRIGELQWDTRFNGTVHRNRLLAFPGLGESSYASTLIIGQSLNVRQGYHYNGIDAEARVYRFKDIDGDGNLSFPNDYVITGLLDPKFYGGVTNTLTYGLISLDAQVDFRLTDGVNFRGRLPNAAAPGRLVNQPVTHAPSQRFTATTSSDAYIHYLRYVQGSALTMVDASFVRLRSVNLSFDVSHVIPERFRLSAVGFFLQAQNALTLSKYRIGDPETQNFLRLPPLTTVHAGIKVSL